MKSANFAWLLGALIIFLVGIPIADDLHALGGPLVRAFTFSILLGVGALSMKGGGRLSSLAMFFAISGIIMNVAATRTSSLWLDYGSFLLILGFLLTASFVTFKHIATDTQISVNRIIGAIAVYLLLGVVWAVAYSLLELSWPNSISGVELVSGGGSWDSEWLYFSFVTMTTLGYGDIAPASAIARMLAYMQAVFGQFYIAILVAGLVSAYISKRD